MTSAVSWRAGVATDPGLQRPNNEDRVFVDESAGIFLVVDGIGGQAGGETAAETAVRVIAECLANATGPLKRRVREAITALAENDHIVVGHVGDSRLYLMWDGKLRKLTSDHSPVGESEDEGEISEREAMAHPRRHQVFRDVGSKPRDPDPRTPR